jgi:hypothetical protein
MDFNTNFLGKTLDNTLHWKQHTDTQIIKLNTACYATRTSKHVVPHCLSFIFLISTLYYVLRHYFLEQPPCSINIFRLPKEKSLELLLNPKVRNHAGKYLANSIF